MYAPGLHQIQPFRIKYEVIQDTHYTRGRFKLDKQTHRLAKTGKTFKIDCQTFSNNLQSTPGSINFNSFESKINVWLIENPFYI